VTAERLKRSATLKWTTNPPSGVGRLGVASRAFAAVPISLAEAEPTQGETTPGEMLACTLAAYLGMHLALRMQEAETPLRELVVDVELTISPWPEYVTEAIELSVLGRLCELDSLAGDAFAGEAQRTLEIAADGLGLRGGLARLVDSQLR
jgi:hypothetical protein